MQLLYNDYVLACEFYYLLDAHPLARVDGRLEGFLAQLAARAAQDGLALGHIRGGVDYPQGFIYRAGRTDHACGACPVSGATLDAGQREQAAPHATSVPHVLEQGQALHQQRAPLLDVALPARQPPQST